MRIRRLSAVFWTTCIIAFIFILYVVTDLSFKLPSIKPAPDVDTKWSSFESKLRHIENELNQHHVVVGEIKSAVDQMVEQSQEYHPPQKRPKEIVYREPQKAKEVKAVGDEPPKMRVPFNESSCPIQKLSVPKTDIQMLSMYERILFDDLDGGVWKQGWEIDYQEDQWSQKNKLKVFIVPHSHNDPGWIKTFENYYKTQTRAIFNNMVEKLSEGIGRKFIWAEISFLSLWWNSDATEKDKAAFLSLLKSGKIEIVTGGWVMNDEANSHWLSIIRQLTTGHQWLIDNMGYIPKNAWAIDPFGYSSTQPYLLKLAGFENSVIQRVHYRVKKELASNKQLEFKWRQLWDGVGKTDMFTHMMPFYSYDVPHSCGPNPKVCCQFDFKRLPGNGVTCPWGVAPRKITEKNVQERAQTILDQWRKKAQLYRSNVVMFPLGDDFRYDRSNEWDNQYQNYEILIDFINNNDAWNAEVQFGTLQDYFKAVHAEVKASDFPVLSGDFFTYADRNQHYWSGYYTSRPFYKNMDRVLLAYVRAAEIITGQACSAGVVSNIMSLQLRDRVEQARRALALFQHHDGVTGTSRDDVREDYAKKLLTAIKYSQSAIQQAAYYLLNQPLIVDQPQEDIYFDVDDIWRSHDEIPTRITIALDAVSPSRRIVLYNALAFKRHEIMTLLVSSPHVEISVHNNPSLPHSEVEISNTLLIDPAVDDLELALRLRTAVKNGDVFYTDLNGMQMIKRRYFEKIPLQANFYPLPAATYIEDDKFRFTVLTSTPLGMAALQSGQIEIMQDRRLSRDDNRGMAQGVLDNIRTRHTFKLIIENAKKTCEKRTPSEHPSGQLTLGAHVSQQYLLQPLIAMHYSSKQDGRVGYSRATANHADLVLAAFHSHVTAKNKDGVMHGMGMTLQRVYLEHCYGSPEISKWYQSGDEQLPISDLVDVSAENVYDSSLTFVNVRNPLPSGVVTLCPMEVRSVFINQTLNKKY
ncbi:alpha-mannosidase 2 isoform X2 [Helicoverpa zea]|uniref:alpha-mannosidase 2 isoform X2 n=1 Tax=Helicoverpa zea TaxID=7113 RepID=UPI001F5956B9|nr:alpha-mannosidase 2 isoform X2 [Helicoverpa zea]